MFTLQNMDIRNIFPIKPSDKENLSVTTSALWSKSGGDIVITTVSGKDFILKDINPETWIIVGAARVKKTGTTATEIFGSCEPIWF